MKKKLKRGMSGLLAALLTFTAVFGSGVTALAASPSGATSKSYSVAFPRDGDANQIYSEDVWGHSAKTYMNGWSTSESTRPSICAPPVGRHRAAKKIFSWPQDGLQME